MKTKHILSAIIGAALLTGTSSCTDMLEEYNPGGGTMEQYAEGSSYQALVNQCYFAMARYFYGTSDGTGGWGKPSAVTAGYMALSEAESDLWTSNGDFVTNQDNYFWFMGGAMNTNYLAGYWNCAYDGIGACNTALDYAKYNKTFSKEQLNSYAAEAHMMRAVYYFNLVEQFGGVVKIVDTSGDNITYSPQRTDPLTIYREVIIPDLEFAAENMLVGDNKTTTAPTQKAAIGFLAKAYLQMTRWTTDETEKQACYKNAFDAAKKLIDDCEAGGAKYNVHMYANLADVFAEKNNYENTEALWKQRWAVDGKSQSGSTGLANLNRNDERFNCMLSHFGARQNIGQDHQNWEGAKEGDFMPTQHLLSLFVQEDGTLDPRFHQWFTTEWKCNRQDYTDANTNASTPSSYTWTESDCKIYGKDASLVGKKINFGDLAVKIVMPQDADYATEVANAATSNYLLVDYKKLYSDAKKEIIDMNADGTENQLRYFYPVLNKHNSSNYVVESYAKYRLGNLNATFIMRTPEVYLIAAEAALQTGDTGSAIKYVNKIRQRAGANLLSTVTLRSILDERGRELCGEYNRFFDLVRTGNLSAAYLQETHPNLAKYFKPEFVLKPIPQTYIDLLENGSEFVNPGY